MRDALSAWAEASDQRALARVAGMLSEACALEAPWACAFAGRLWLEGHGVTRDVERGLGLLERACGGGVALACGAGAAWLGDPLKARQVPGAPELRARFELEQGCLTAQADSCYRAGLLFYFGRDGFPRDRARAARAYARGCALGDSRACNNLGDALAYGDGVARDVEVAATLFAKACRLGEALGCANLGYMAEHGQGVSQDRAMARGLYRDACATGDLYACLHADLLAAEDAGAPRAAPRALEHWQQACDSRKDGRACAFVGLIYEDGPDGLARDEARSEKAMARACGLGEKRACEWVVAHPGD